MKNDDAKSVVNVVNELSESYLDFIHTMKGTIREVSVTKHLWRDQNKSKLVKLGLALIVFPEPTPISETIGACLVAAGTVQQEIRRRSLYVEDVYKTFKDTLKEIWTAKHTV